MTLTMRLLKLLIIVWSRFAPKSNSKHLINLLFKVRKRGYPTNQLTDPDNTHYLEANTTLLYWKGLSSKTVLLVHGWNGSGDQFFSFYEQFHAMGYSIYVVSPKGYGLSASTLSNPGCFIKSINIALEFIDKPIDVAIGHSMGAGALLYVASQAKKIEKLVAISAPSDFTNILDDFCRKLAVGKKAKQLFFSKAEQEIGIKHAELNISAIIHKIETPILFIHDENDKVLSLENSVILNDEARNSQLIATRNLGHTRLLNSTSVVKYVMRFIGVQ